MIFLHFWAYWPRYGLFKNILKPRTQLKHNICICILQLWVLTHLNYANTKGQINQEGSRETKLYFKSNISKTLVIVVFEILLPEKNRVYEIISIGKERWSQIWVPERKMDSKNGYQKSIGISNMVLNDHTCYLYQTLN